MSFFYSIRFYLSLFYLSFVLAPFAGAELSAGLSFQKPTVCTVTINSSDEKEVFQSYLGDDFNFIELTELGAEEGGYRDWFVGACKKGIECDILVVSGHFGGSFFGSSAYRLGLTELQRRSCQEVCNGILKKPKEVFLFGCNTTAGKSRDHRTPEEYTRVLIEDGFSRRHAEQISAFRYSPIGEQTKDRMKQVFPHSRIYGFHSLAPSGKNIVPRLKSYFKSVKDYKAHLEQFPTTKENKNWSLAMRGQWIRSVDGNKEIENPVCVLGQSLPIYKKLYWIDEVLSDERKSLAYIPVIDFYLKDLERSFDGDLWESFPSEEQSLLEHIQFNEEGRKRVEELLLEPIDGVLSAQVQVLNFGRRVAWYDRESYSLRLKGLIGDMLKENLDREQTDLICSLAVEMDLSLEDLPEENWNEHTIYAIRCMRPKSIKIHLALVKALEDPDAEVRRSAVWALGEIKPEDSKVIFALISLLKDPDAQVRRYAVEALGEIKPEDSKVIFALISLLKDPNMEFRRSAVWALGEIKPENPEIISTLASLLKDPTAEVRRYAVWGFGRDQAGGL